MNELGRDHNVFIGIGSNIRPKFHIPLAVRRLRTMDPGLIVSSVYQSHAEGSEGPDFLNAVILFRTPLDLTELRSSVLHPIEDELGRIRTKDKNAPRTIDLDILTFDGDVVDETLWTKVYIAVPLAELRPSLDTFKGSKSIKEIASQLEKRYFIKKQILII